MGGTQKKCSREYLELLDNIPGGILQCERNRSLSLVVVNQGFLELFGYTREEIAEQFDDCFINMIHPLDRPDVLEKNTAQLAGRDKLTLQYRVVCKDGTYKWVMESSQLLPDEKEENCFISVMLNITELKNAREELRLTLERHQMILDQTADIIFEWDIEKNTLFFSANWEKKFGYEPNYDGREPKQSFTKYIHPEDIPRLSALMKSMQEGTAYASLDVRIQKMQGQYIWCRIRATNQYDYAGKPLKAIGVITDIDDEKKLVDDLRKRAERDALTGLYNREETERKICDYIQNNPKELGALLMIDTDNFKRVNDKQGHLFGDAVLSELAAGMKRLTRQTDVVGRIGGDEFTIFLKNIASRAEAEEKAAQLLDLFAHLFQQGKQPIKVTCSAGVAIFPEDGRDFQTLYHSADLALYQAKRRGKNQYVLFDKEARTPVNQIGYSALGAAIDSDQTSGTPGDLINYVFQILYDSSDISHVIQLILEIVGKRFDVSRAYVFENSDDGKYCNNTYEWCNEGIVPQKENLQHFAYEDVGNYRELFKDNSIFYCRDIHSLTPEKKVLFESQGICSTLQCAILEENVFHGFVGFDECTGMRMWTKEEIGTLSLISQLLTTFLLKKRATERDEELVIRLNTILDTQEAYIYAIEQGTYELLYLNQKAQELAPKAQTGMTCYGAFFNRQAPCEICPFSSAVDEIYNPQYDVWTRVKVSSMKWGAMDAFLLTCYDITKYKRIQWLNTGSEEE